MSSSSRGSLEDTKDIDQMVEKFHHMRDKVLQEILYNTWLQRNDLPNELRGLRHALMRASKTDRSNIISLVLKIVETQESMWEKPAKNIEEYESRTIVRRVGDKKLSSNAAYESITSLAICGHNLRIVTNVEQRKRWKADFAKTIKHMKDMDYIPS